MDLVSSLTSQNDPLKQHTNGMKKDYLSPYKMQTMQKHVQDQDKQYYPTDTVGVIDEWGALAKHQDALFEAYKKQERI